MLLGYSMAWKEGQVIDVVRLQYDTEEGQVTDVVWLQYGTEGGASY